MTADDPMRDADERREFADKEGEVAELTAACKALGGYVAETGGGLTAWWFDLSTERYALLTHHHDDHEGPLDDPAWMAGLYDMEDGEQLILKDEQTFVEALAHIMRWRSGAKGVRP